MAEGSEGTGQGLRSTASITTSAGLSKPPRETTAVKSKLIKAQAASATQRHMMDSRFPSWGKRKITPADWGVLGGRPV